jgi:hypothetical protein
MVSPVRALLFDVPGYEIGHGFAFQMLAAYSAIVRSLENFPDAATFLMALRVHASGSAYKCVNRSSVSRYDFRSVESFVYFQSLT